MYIPKKLLGRHILRNKKRRSRDHWFHFIARDNFNNIIFQRDKNFKKNERLITRSFTIFNFYLIIYSIGMVAICCWLDTKRKSGVTKQYLIDNPNILKIKRSF
jgi:hypothetical protein